MCYGIKHKLHLNYEDKKLFWLYSVVRGAEVDGEEALD